MLMTINQRLEVLELVCSTIAIARDVKDRTDEEPTPLLYTQYVLEAVSTSSKWDQVTEEVQALAIAFFWEQQ